MSETIVRKNILSQREQDIRNRLFKKKKRCAEYGGNTEERDQTTIRKRDANREREDEEIKKLYNDLHQYAKTFKPDAEATKINNEQNAILKDYAKILRGNQDILKSIAKREGKSKEKEGYVKKEDLQHILKPFIIQAAEVQKIFNQAKNSAKEVNQELRTLEKNPEDDQTERDSLPNKYGQYLGQQKKLEAKFKEVDELSKQYKKKLKDVENLDARLMISNISRLKSSLDELQNKSKAGHAMIERKMNDLNRRYNMALPQTYAQMIKKNVDEINYNDSRVKVLRKLGQEFDYTAFRQDLDTIMDDLEVEKDNLKTTINNLEPGEVLPSYYKEELVVPESKSVLEDVKNRIQVIKDMVEHIARPKPEKTPVNYLRKDMKPKDFSWNRLSKPKKKEKLIKANPAISKKSKKTKKPMYLLGLQSQPEACKPDIKFKKIQNANFYDTFFDPSEADKYPKMAQDANNEQIPKKSPNESIKPDASGTAPMFNKQQGPRYLNTENLNQLMKEETKRRHIGVQSAGFNRSLHSPRFKEQSRPTEMQEKEEYSQHQQDSEDMEPKYINYEDADDIRKYMEKPGLPNKYKGFPNKDVVQESLSENYATISDYFKSKLNDMPFKDYAPTNDNLQPIEENESSYKKNYDYKPKYKEEPPKMEERLRDEDIDRFSQNMIEILTKAAERANQRMGSSIPQSRKEEDFKEERREKYEQEDIEEEEPDEESRDRINDFDIQKYYERLNNQVVPLDQSRGSESRNYDNLIDKTESIIDSLDLDLYHQQLLQKPNYQPESDQKTDYFNVDDNSDGQIDLEGFNQEDKSSKKLRESKEIIELGDKRSISEGQISNFSDEEV